MEDQLKFDRECLEAVKTLGKTLGQLSLYKVGHPAVTEALKNAEGHLAQAMGQTEQGDLLLAIDQDKLISNGRIIGATASLPSHFNAFYNRFKLNSLTFKTGLSVDELASFCELYSSRPDSPAAAKPKEYLEGRGVTHIVLNEAVYTKKGEEALLRAMAEKSLDETIRILVGNAINDPKKYDLVYSKVTELIRTDIEKRVEEVAGPLRRERNLLKNEQSRTQHVLTGMAEGVVIVDEEGRVLMMNPAAEDIYGASLSQVAGLPLGQKAGESHLVTLASEIDTPGDRPIKAEISSQAIDETRRTIKSATAVVQNESGKVVGMVSTLTDVAKHKEIQKKEREFIAHVTHELRAPLASIKAALDIIQEESTGTMPEEQGRMLKTAISNSDRLELLINGILDFSKIESGQMTVYPKPCEPAHMAQEAADGMKPWALKRQIEIVMALEPSLPIVMADWQRTIQVMVNLISNAIKFSPKAGKITIGVSRAYNGKDRSVRFSVKDMGPGIPASEHNKIFEKFVQIASGEMHVGGTGLGLAIAKALIHLQNGKLWLESEPGKGATFIFSLPAQEDKEVIPLPVKAPKPWWKHLLGID